MNQELQQLMKEQWAQLPSAVQKALVAPDLQQKIIKVGDANQLHVDQKGVLSDETVLLMLGLTHPDDFVSILTERLGVDAAAAEKVAQDIGREIVLPIREQMKKDVAAEEAASAAQQPAPADKNISVVMPSKAAAPVPAVTTPPVNLPAPAPAPAAAPALATPVQPAPAPAAPMHPADVMMTEPTISVAPKPAAQPAPKSPSYKVDPYREPTE